MRLQSFSLSVIPEILSRLIPIIYGLALMEIAIQFKQPSWFALLLLIGLLGTAFALSLWQRWFERLHDIGPRLESSNVIGEIAPKAGTKRRLVLLAHYDSKSQMLPIAFRGASYLGLVVAAVGLMLVHGVGQFWSAFPFWRITGILGGLALLCGVLLQLNFTRNHSPGASDNAAAVGILLELARVFGRDPLQHVHLTLLFTGAEEWGMAGALRYIQANPTLDPDTQFINIDGVGPDATLGLLKSYGIVPRDTGGQLATDLERLAQRLSLRIQPMHAAVGIGLDHFPIAARGYEALMLCTRSLRMALRIHSRRDMLKHVTPAAMERVGTLCETYARELDQRSCSH